MDMEERVITVSNGNIPILSCGTGSTMLFLHGGAAMPRAYLPLLTLLSKQFRVIAPTHPGHGDAFSIPSTWKLAQFLDVYEEFLHEEKIVPEIIVGHSLGAALGLLFAAHGVGKQVIAMDSPGLPFQITAADFVQAKAKEARELISRRNKRHVQDALAAVGAVLHTVVKHPEDIPWLWQQAPTWDLTEALTSIHTPVSLFWGARDGIVPLSVGERMQKIISHATLTVFPHRGHNYPILDPEFTFHEIMKVINE